MISKERFEGFDAFHRGWAVYMYGANEEEPNVPDEKNPYPIGTEENDEWYKGNTQAIFDVMDSEG